MIRIDHSHLQTSAVSDQGMQRKNNEDRYGVTAFQSGLTPALLAIVCDGIGGHLAGEVAAELAVETLTSVIAASDASQPLETLGLAVQAANQAVHNAAKEQSERRGMGATCTVAWVIGIRLYTTTVGDSPLFLIRNAKIQRISTPHTWVQEAVEAGVLTEEAARVHPNAHVIRRYLGSPDPVTLDFRLKLNPGESNEQATANQGTELQAGDMLILCSDGLTDMVETQEILDTILQKGLAEGVPALRDLANENGGMDNITIVGVEIPASAITAAFDSSAPTIPMQTAARSDQSLDAKTIQIKRPVQPQPAGLKTLLKNKFVWLGCSLLALLAVGLLAAIIFFSFLANRVEGKPTPTASTVPALALTLQAATPAEKTPLATAALPTAQDAQLTPLAPDAPTYTPWPTKGP